MLFGNIKLFQELHRKPVMVACFFGGLMALAGTIFSCSDLLTVDVDTTAEATVDGSPLGGLLGALPFDGLTSFDIADSGELANQGVGPEDIESVVLTVFTLEVTAPNDQDLSFFNSIAFYVEADGLDRIRIASLDEFPDGVQEVELDLDDVDIVDYVVADSMEITTEVNAEVPENTTTIEAYVSFAVTATVKGACNAAKDELSDDDG